MKKTITLILIIGLILGLSFPVYADSSMNNATYEEKAKASELYGIPIEHLDNMNDEEIATYLEDIDTKEVVSRSTSYFKEVINEDGTSEMVESTLEDYLAEKFLRTSQNGWIRITATIISVNSTTGEITGAYTWLTSPAVRRDDCVGLSLTQGTIVANSASGYYLYENYSGRHQINYSSGSYKYEGHGITKLQNIYNQDAFPSLDVMFIKARIYKESGSEGLNASYAHQKTGISLSPSFTISRNGLISLVSGSIGTNYDQFSDYTSIRW